MAVVIGFGIMLMGTAILPPLLFPQAGRHRRKWYQGVAEKWVAYKATKYRGRHWENGLIYRGDHIWQVVT